MLLKKKKNSSHKLIQTTCTIISVQEYPGRLVINMDRKLSISIQFTEDGYRKLCKIGHLAGIKGEFKVQDLLGRELSVLVFNNVITKIVK